MHMNRVGISLLVVSCPFTLFSCCALFYPHVFSLLFLCIQTTANQQQFFIPLLDLLLTLSRKTGKQNTNTDLKLASSSRRRKRDEKASSKVMRFSAILKI